VNLVAPWVLVYKYLKIKIDGTDTKRYGFLKGPYKPIGTGYENLENLTLPDYPPGN